MKTFFRLMIVLFAILAVAQFVSYYIPTWYQTVAFTAPIVGTMTYAYCMLTGIGLSMMVAVFGK